MFDWLFVPFQNLQDESVAAEVISSVLMAETENLLHDSYEKNEELKVWANSTNSFDLNMVSCRISPRPHFALCRH